LYNNNFQKIPSKNVNVDIILFLICESKPHSTVINVYNLSELDFKPIIIFKLCKKIESIIYKHF